MQRKDDPELQLDHAISEAHAEKLRRIDATFAAIPPKTAAEVVSVSVFEDRLAEACAKVMLGEDPGIAPQLCEQCSSRRRIFERQLRNDEVEAILVAKEEGQLYATMERLQVSSCPGQLRGKNMRLVLECDDSDDDGLPGNPMFIGWSSRGAYGPAGPEAVVPSVSSTPCGDCKGKGTYQGLGAPEPCRACNGKGTT